MSAGRRTTTFAFSTWKIASAPGATRSTSAKVANDAYRNIFPASPEPGEGRCEPGQARARVRKRGPARTRVIRAREPNAHPPRRALQCARRFASVRDTFWSGQKADVTRGEIATSTENKTKTPEVRNRYTPLAYSRASRRRALRSQPRGTPGLEASPHTPPGVRRRASTPRRRSWPPSKVV